MEAMVIWLRNTIYLTLLAVLTPWLLYRRFTTDRYRAGIAQKFWGLEPTHTAWHQSDVPGANPTSIWLHGVSVGEVQLLLRLRDRLAQLLPNARFTISTTTETGMELASRLYKDRAHTQLIYFPLDFSWAIRRTLRSVQPDLIVLGELELWPNLIAIAHAESIPLAVVNGRISPRSFRGYQRLKWLVQPMFAKLRMVAAQSEEYAQRFVACGTPSERVSTTGSFKFDNVCFDRQSAQVEHLKRLCGLQEKHRVWVVGSTQQPEELAAGRAYLAAKDQFPTLRLIVVPRHQERFDQVVQQLSELPVRLQRRSAIDTTTSNSSLSAEDWDVLVVDCIGELRWWWGLAEIALVGGSFGQRGGQNMLEPAAYGINTAFGPNTVNFRAIVEMLLTAEAATQLRSLDDLPVWLQSQLSDPTAGQHRGNRAQQLILNHQGALDRTAQHLLKLLGHDF